MMIGEYDREDVDMEEPKNIREKIKEGIDKVLTFFKPAKEQELLEEPKETKVVDLDEYKKYKEENENLEKIQEKPNELKMQQEQQKEEKREIDKYILSKEEKEEINKEMGIRKAPEIKLKGNNKENNHDDRRRIIKDE